ncbi:hypothetical protein [Corynebacterium auris]|uniref:hypothetical protein n=1 Tax=Corynebacterium auris TaxID=44750 RepID=UPI003F492111
MLNRAKASVERRGTVEGSIIRHHPGDLDAVSGKERAGTPLKPAAVSYFSSARISEYTMRE